jgi:hypothetical protein
MKILLNISLVWLLSQVECWKPIAHPAAYTVEQTFSDHENLPVARSSSNSIVYSSSGDSVDHLLDSFNKNSFVNDVSLQFQQKVLTQGRKKQLVFAI